LPAPISRWGWTVALGVLVILTSFAVASVSTWLVLPYLVLMGLVLLMPGGDSKRKSSHASAGQATLVVLTKPANKSPAIEDPAAEAEWGERAAGLKGVGGLVETATLDSASRALRTRRGKGRMRKGKGPAESSTAAAAWVQVGPGRFVRVEGPVPTVAAAPFESESASERDGSEECSNALPGSLIPAEEDQATLADPMTDEPISMAVGGDLEQASGGRCVESSEATEFVEIEQQPAAVLPLAGIEADCGTGLVGSAVEMTGGAPDQALADVEALVKAVAIPTMGPVVDAESERESGATRDVVKDNGIAPEAFSKPAGDNGITPEALVDVPSTGIQSENASARDHGVSSPVPLDFLERPHRGPLGMLPRLRRVYGPRYVRAMHRQPGRGVTSPGRRTLSDRRGRVSTGLRRPARSATVRSRQCCRTFPPRSPPYVGLDREPLESAGACLAVPFGNPGGQPERPRSRLGEAPGAGTGVRSNGASRTETG
jgi:hypothetical protein